MFSNISQNVPAFLDPHQYAVSRSTEDGITTALLSLYHCQQNQRADFYFREKEANTPVSVSGADMEQVSSFRFLAIYVTEKLSSTLHIISLVKKRGGGHRKGFYLIGVTHRPVFSMYKNSMLDYH